MGATGVTFSGSDWLAMGSSTAPLGSMSESGTLLGNASLGLSIGGGLTSAIGSYYSVQAAQYRARAHASALLHQQQLSYINARQAERDAQGSILAGQRDAAMAGQRYGQIKAAIVARQSASGIQAGVGSAAEVAASVEIAKQTDMLTITRNSVRQANASRTGRVNALNRASAAGAQASTLGLMASSMNPGLAAGTSLIGGAGQVARQWYNYNQSR